MATFTTNHYDLIVLGSDISGLVTAALVAGRGRRVLIIPGGPIGGSYRVGKTDLPVDTAPLVHLRCPAVRRVCDELGLWPQIRREHKLVSEFVHWILPEQRLDIRSDAHSWLPECLRAWPQDPIVEAWDLRTRWMQATESMLDELLASEGALTIDGFWARRFLSRMSSQLPTNNLDDLKPLDPEHPLRQMVYTLQPWLQCMALNQLGKAAGWRITGLWDQGPFDHTGGMPALRAQLLQRIRLKSGEIKSSLRISEILVKRSRAVGIGLLGKRDRYGCENLVIATDPRILLDGLIAPEQFPRTLANLLHGVRPVAIRYVLHIEAKADCVSAAIGGPMIVVPDLNQSSPRESEASTAPPTWQGQGTMYIRVSPGSDENTRIISITRIEEVEPELSGIRKRILDELHLRGVFPFMRGHIHWMYSPHDGMGVTDAAGQRIEKEEVEAEGRIEPEYLYSGPESPTALGVGMLPHSTGIRNLCFASRLTYPGLGLEGEFVAGLAAAGTVIGRGRGLRTLFPKRF